MGQQRWTETLWDLQEACRKTLERAWSAEGEEQLLLKEEAAKLKALFWQLYERNEGQVVAG